MINLDFVNQQYFGEVVRIRSRQREIPKALEPLVYGKWTVEEHLDDDGKTVEIYHGSFQSEIAFHRATRIVKRPNGKSEEIPKTRHTRTRNRYLYDVLYVQKGPYALIAVPFYGLANSLFVKIDRALAGTRISYQTLNLTTLIMQLGKSELSSINTDSEDDTLVVTRCHLAYSDPVKRSRNIEQLRMSGNDLGATEIYARLITPVLKPKEYTLSVTPTMVGFALYVGGARKTSAITDRHGNFKLFISPGLRQALRVFRLLETVDRLHGVSSSTTNIPILQSKFIEDVE